MDISFKDLNLHLKDETLLIDMIDYNIVLEIKTYLPVNEKLQLIERVISQSMEENDTYQNPIKIEIFSNLEIVKAYTNLKFSDDEWADPATLYDLLEDNDIIAVVISNLPKDEYNFLVNGINDTIKALYDYKNSAAGILENISNDYSTLDLDASNIQAKLADENNLTLLRSVMNDLG